MTSMDIRTESEVLDAVEHLPERATLLVPMIEWDDYEHLLESLVDRPGLRISYDCGNLEIVSPGSEHGAYERLIEDLVTSACEILRLRLEKRANTTWKRRTLLKGVEGDASYYFGNVERIIGKGDLDLEIDPQPDVILEIDLTSNSRRKFSIYAALGIPEIWRYDGKTCSFYKLNQGVYVDSTASRFIPQLTGQMLADAVELSKTEGQDKARAAFRRVFGRSLKQRQQD